jgi:putative nucleotidyltransferase with HDIG domain
MRNRDFDNQRPAPPEPSRWQARPVLSALLRAVVLLVPLASGVTAAAWLSRAIDRPSGSGMVWWWAMLLGASLLAVRLVERASRRLLPLAVLLRLSLLFPDEAPSRFALARRVGNVRILQQRIRDARERGIEDDPARAAEAILSLVAALSAHDRKTRGHSERVRAFADMLAESLQLAPEDRDRLRWGALLHDIGKLHVSGKILNKAGKPEPREWEALKLHPEEGARLAGPLLPWLGIWGRVIVEHHERYDGGGYPHGLSGDEISLGGRMVTLTDSFETMTAARSYKKPMTASAAREELARCAGSQFDPALVRAFLNVSLGRLRWTIGPMAWLAQIPFLGGVQRAAWQTVTCTTNAAGVATTAVAGVLALGIGAVTGGGRPVDRTPLVSPRPAAASQLEPGLTSPDGSSLGPAVGPTRPGKPPVETADEVGPGPNPGQDEPSPTESPSDEPDPDPGPDPGPDRDPVSDLVDTVEEASDDVVGTVDDVVNEVESAADDLTEGASDLLDQTVDGLLGPSD